MNTEHPISSQSLELEYTMGRSTANNLYHVPVIRNTLTRNLGTLSGEIYDEICNAFAHCIPATDGGSTPITVCGPVNSNSASRSEWTAVPALETMMQVVARTSSRIFVGLPLCASFLRSRRIIAHL